VRYFVNLLCSVPPVIALNSVSGPYFVTEVSKFGLAQRSLLLKLAADLFKNEDHLDNFPFLVFFPGDFFLFKPFLQDYGYVGFGDKEAKLAFRA
jgi:hypothetical protein